MERETERMKTKMLIEKCPRLFEAFCIQGQSHWLDKSFSANECIRRLSTFELEMRFSVWVSNTIECSQNSPSPSHVFTTNSCDKRTHNANYMQFISEMTMRNSFGVFRTMCGFHMQMHSAHTSLCAFEFVYTKLCMCARKEILAVGWLVGWRHQPVHHF